MKALILAAGYGTRLYPYTKYFPKPLLEVNKKPVIGYLLDKLEKLDGLTRVVVVTNARFYKHFLEWRKSSRLKDKIRIVNDLTRSPKEKLGAIADMYLGLKKEGLDDNFLVLGGDNFLEEPLNDFFKFAQKKKPQITIGVVGVGSRREARHYGVVLLNRNKQIIDFQEKPLQPKSRLAAMCLYYFPRSKLGLVKKCIRSCRPSFDNIGTYIGWLARQERVYGFTFKKMWFDIGSIETYRKLNKLLRDKG